MTGWAFLVLLALFLLYVPVRRPPDPPRRT